jgi:hypothetical protein
MLAPPAGVSDSDWEATPPAVRALLEQQINRVAQLEEQKGRSSRKSSKPPSSDGAGYRCAEALRATSLQPKRRAKAVAANAVAKTGILAPTASSSPRNSARRSFPISPPPASVAGRPSAVRIQSLIAIRWSTFQRSCRL